VKSGKHIDKYFDDLIQEIIQMHNQIKQRYRSQIEQKMSQDWERYEKQNIESSLDKFRALKAEIDQFKKEDRVAEISLNAEHYEAHLAKLEEVEWEFGTHYAELLARSIPEGPQLPEALIKTGERQRLLAQLQALIRKRYGYL